MLDSIDTDTINTVVLDKVTDPSVPCVDNVCVLGVDISKGHLAIAQPALFNRRLVVEVVAGLDEALLVEVGLRVEWREGAEIRRVLRRCHVVHHDVDHQVHTTVVQRLRERLEVVSRAKVRVQLGNVGRPVSMERLAVSSRSLHILDNGRDPNSVETHALDVIQLLDDTLPCSATVLAIFSVACRAGAVGRREPVCDQLTSKKDKRRPDVLRNGQLTW